MGFMLRERLCWGGSEKDGGDRVGSSVVPSEKGGPFRAEGEKNAFISDGLGK